MSDIKIPEYYVDKVYPELGALIEHLSNWALRSFEIKKLHQYTKGKNVKVLVGDGSKGYEPGAPYDKIIVTCATPEIFQSWKDQLKEQ